MFRAWYVPFYFYGVIHGDPHLGNYTVRADGGVNLLDFGCIRVFPPKFVARRDRPLSRARATATARSPCTPTRPGASTICRKELIAVLNRWAALRLRAADGGPARG